jgi:threonyl-tRNA synthetase
VASVDRENPSYKLRHSTAHVLAQAVREMFPEAKLGWGPPHDRFENGFYYDFDLPRALTPEDLPEVEERMRRIIRDDHPFRYRVVGADEARELFADQPYKLETIEELEGDKDEYGETRSGGAGISTYKQDTFEDLCLGPHLERTGRIPPDGFMLLDVSGAYWRGNEENPMLQRVHGTVWPTKEELESYLRRREEEERRDHRRLGAELDLFSIQPEVVGPGLALFHPKGALARVLMEDYWRERHREGGYDFVATPHVGRAALWDTSGHLRWYADGMYSAIEIEDERYYLKPMNCPFHMLIFKSGVRSYRDLPMRFAELGTVYRYEPSGTLRGLLRVRGFTQDDAHLFCRPDQMQGEIDRVLAFCLSFLADYGFGEPKMELSVRDPQTPQKYAGSEVDWEMAESTLATALERCGLPYERVEGEAVFYGPKIDIGITDALGRRWQASTIQFDFNLPERFDLTYVGEDNRPHRPYMVHRALYGSIERFFALLIEHHAGALPVWLAPTQAMVIPVAERNLDYAREVIRELTAAGFRAEADGRPERINAKIRDAQMQKIPYMLVVGEREEEAQGVSVRLRTNENRGMIGLPSFVDHLREVVEAKSGL